MPKKDYDTIHRGNVDIYARKIQAIYDSAIKEASAIGSTVSNFDPSKPFSFSDYPITHDRVKKLSKELQGNLEAVVLNGIDHEWTLSNNKNNELCNRVFGDNVGKLTKEQYRRYYSNNGKAADAFKARKVAGLNLSDRVWKYTDRFKTEIEFGIDLDLRDGTSAADMARNLKQYLQNPDKLFRRVRDEHGQLHLSKAAKAFKPGQGVYRSSAKNAERLARTETNMAYHAADHERWQQFDFVVGVEVRRSNNLSCHCPLCDSLADKYPKDFKFTGWHPQCRCHAVPVLKTVEELKADTERIINGEPTNTESVNTVNQMPDSFTSWIDDNKGRFGANNTPYFIRDNEKYIKPAEHLPTIAERAALRHSARTPMQIEAIRSEWNERKAIRHYGQNIMRYMGGISDVDTTNLAEILNGGNIEAILIEARKLKTTGKQILALNRLDDPMQVARQFSMNEAKLVNEAVQTKLDGWKMLTAQKRIEKLNYEIQWIENNKKYSTWKVAQDAYRKELVQVEYQVAKQTIETNTTHAFEFLKSTKSTKVKTLADEMKMLLGKNAPIDQLNAKSVALNNEVSKLELAKMARDAKKNGISPDAYSQARKDAAVWAKSAKEADVKVRPVCSKVWSEISQKHKDAVYLYTHNYSPINEPLRGVTYYGSKAQKTVGRKAVPLITETIEKSYYDFDMWLQRGEGASGFVGKFGIDLRNLTELEAQKLVGTEGIEKAFMSCGNSKGAGFTHHPVIYNIYAPKGTKMMYLEPFSRYGNGARSATWDGVSTQSHFGSEAEMLLQRGSKLRITKIKNTAGTWYVDIEVIGSDITEFIP